jgi:hypothetical protein
MDKANLTLDNGTVQFNYASHIDSAANVIQVGRTVAPGYLPPAVASQMTGLAAFLHSDVAAAWALAGELSGGVPALRAIIFGMSAPSLAALSVGAAAFGATTAIDKYFDGAIHTAFLDAVLMVGSMDHGLADAYFGADGFTTDSNNVPMMDEICSNWQDFWENIPQLIAPIQLPLA